MEYLDPKKEFRHRVLLLIGYISIAVAITMAAIILLYQAYGFGIGKGGAVIQNGLTFFSSHPNPADIYIDGKLMKVRTNTRLVLPEGTYGVTLARNGYEDWKRAIQLDGGSVMHYDYPFLIPKVLNHKKIANFATQPSLVTQSLDRRWLLVNQPSEPLVFDVYDLKNPAKTPVAITLPTGTVTNPSSASGYALVEWADDNDHVIAKHILPDGKFEYILISRTDPASSQNLTTSLKLPAGELSLNDRKYDKYYLFDKSTGSLQTVSLKAPTITPLLQRVLAYKSYGDDTILFATDNGAPAGKVLIKLKIADTTYTLRNFDAGSTYLVDLTTYSGSQYVALGAAAKDRIYIYKNPLAQLRKNPRQALTPLQVLRIEKPNKLSFSSNAQFIATENTQQFALYDIENAAGYKYVAKEPIDQPQAYATWMDGNRFTYVSSGKQIIFDYDYKNAHSLAAASPMFLPAFAPNYNYVYTVAPNSQTSGQFELLQTSLLTPADQK